MPQFDFSVFAGQVFWLLVSFGTLYMGVRFIVFPMFESIFTARKKLIDVPLEKAEKITNDTQALEEEIEKKKMLQQKHNEEKLRSVYQKELVRLQEVSKKTDESLAGALRKTVQKINNDEALVLKNIDLFVQKALKGDK